MALGPFISMLLRMLPDILLIWRRRAEIHDKEQIDETQNEFNDALHNGDVDDAGALLERRLREAR